MRDVDDPDTSLGDLCDGVEERRLLSLGERRRRFIQDEDADIADQGRGDLGELAVGVGEVLDDGLRVEREAVLLEEAPCFTDDATPLCDTEAAGLSHQEHVVRDGHRRDEAELLVDDGDACCARAGRRSELDFLPVDANRAVVLGDDSGQDLR